MAAAAPSAKRMTALHPSLPFTPAQGGGCSASRTPAGVADPPAYDASFFAPPRRYAEPGGCSEANTRARAPGDGDGWMPVCPPSGELPVKDTALAGKPNELKLNNYATVSMRSRCVTPIPQGYRRSPAWLQTCRLRSRRPCSNTEGIGKRKATRGNDEASFHHAFEAADPRIVRLHAVRVKVCRCITRPQASSRCAVRLRRVAVVDQHDAVIDQTSSLWALAHQEIHRPALRKDHHAPTQSSTRWQASRRFGILHYRHRMNLPKSEKLSPVSADRSGSVSGVSRRFVENCALTDHADQHYLSARCARRRPPSGHAAAPPARRPDGFVVADASAPHAATVLLCRLQTGPSPARYGFREPKADGWAVGARGATGGKREVSWRNRLQQ